MIELSHSNLVVSVQYTDNLQCTQFRGTWENVMVTIERPGPLDPNGPCANTRPTDDQMVISLPDSKTRPLSRFLQCWRSVILSCNVYSVIISTAIGNTVKL